MVGSRLFLRNSLSLLIMAGMLLSTGGGVLARQSVAAIPDRSPSDPLHSPSDTPYGLAAPEADVRTLRVYGESGLDAAFPYASENYTGPFALTNAEAPPKDFVQFNPAVMRHDDDKSLGVFEEYFGNAIQAGGDANEEAHLRMWYVPQHATPWGLTYPAVDDPVYNPQGDIVLEYTYILLEPDTFDPQTGPPQATQLVFPLAGSGEQPGLDQMDVNEDDQPEALGIDRIVGVVTGTLGTHQVITYPNGITDDLITTRGVIQVSAKGALEPPSVPAGGQVQFLDYMAKVEGVSPSGDWADVSLWYVGNSTPALLGTVNLGLDEVALVGRFWSPKVEEYASEAAAEAAAEAAMVTTGLPARPFWVTLESITWNDGQWRARLTPHRLLMAGETLFVDCVEYDVAAILVEDVNADAGTLVPEFKYITLRNPLPKWKEGDEDELIIDDLTVRKCKIAADTDLWLLPPFNYQHDMVDDVNIPEDSNSLGPDAREMDNITTNHIVASYDLIAERIVEDTPALVGDSSVRWVAEEKEERFDTNLLEEQFLQTQVGDEWDARWQWINIQTMPWDFTEFSLPALLDKPTETGYDSGDYILVSSFLTEDSADTEHGSGAVRLKFAYDADRSFSDIYVNNVCQKTLRVYGESGLDAAFPYASENYIGPFALTNAEAPKKDFVQFNPAAMRHDDPDSLGQFGEYFGNAIQAGGDANEKVHLRTWYTPQYPAPRGLTYPEVDDPVYNPDGDIVLEYTYILLEPDTFDPQTGPPGATRLVFPLAGSEGQHGLDRMDVNGDQKPETLSIDEIVGVVTGTLGAHQVITLTDGITDNLITTRGIIQVSPQEAQAPIYVPVYGQVQFLDYMAKLEGVSKFGGWADVSLWYIGNATSSLLGTVRLELNTAALAGRFWGPAAAKFGDATQAEAAAEAAMVTTGLPARPFWVTLDSIVEINGVVHARLTPHRLLMTGETLFVDCVEYDVAAILVQDANLDAGEVDAEIQYITLRNPLPKGAGELDISPLTVYKCKIPASTNLWMLPPLNYEHDVVDDVNVPEDWNTLGPDAQEADNITTNHIVSGYDLIEERIVEDTPALDGDPFIGWVTEAKEGRFDTNLLEETYTQTVSSHMYGPQTDGIQGINWLWDEDWQWINVETMPWDYTELSLPALPGQADADDYILVSSFLTQDAVRLKFAYDPANGTGIYVDPRPGSQEGFFQGRVKLESAAYQELALDVQVIAQGGVVAGTTVSTDASGYFTLSLDPGVYDVWVKEAHALAKRMDDRVITDGVTTACDFGEFMVGDANNNNQVYTDDYVIWQDTLRSTTDLRADFNLDGQVTSLDFGWIKQNLGQPGDDPLIGPASASCGGAATSSLPDLSPAATVTLSLDPATQSVAVGEVFTLAIKVAAGVEEVDSADVFINFDLERLEVVSVAGSAVLVESGKDWDNPPGAMELFYGVADLNKTVSETFTLATITFRATKATLGTPVTFSVAPLRKTTVNSGVTPLSLVTQPATVYIYAKEYFIYLPLIVRNYPPVYTVSGHVTDGDAQPVSDVTISSGTSHTAATGSDGSYTLDGLLAGTYSIAPSKAGYTFAPASHTVSVPPTVVGQNFVATPPPTPTPTPTSAPTATPTPTSTPSAGATPTHTPPPTPLPCTEVVANGSFEIDGYWDLPQTAYPAAYTSAAAHYGYRSMRVGILNPADNRYSYSSARQLVAIPANATSATLRFWLYPVSGEPPANLSLPARLLTLMTQDATLYGDAQYVDLLDQNDQRLTELLWQRRDDQVWMYHQFDLMAYAGQTIKLYFGAYNDGAGGVTGMYVDDVSLEVCTYP